MSGIDTETVQDVETQSEKKTAEPPLYKVLLHNDDYTTKEFVVNILASVFNKTLDDAVRLMWHIHRSGVGVAGVYPFEVAETKIRMVEALAKENGFPLKTTMEKE
ncbi:MAG: ATP-dependent Clp protease adaptor ClpS [Desulfobacteraceae bacterium]|jgi:ATP-dependent Clp protease adaptor protein ClpS|nr:ATP-dependent Clp protease adaptor ClpS [Desulfobacteraceae bacterium]